MSAEQERARDTMSSAELRRQMKIMDKKLRRAAQTERGFLGFGEQSLFNFRRFWTSSFIKFTYFLGFLVLNGVLAVLIIRALFGLPGEILAAQFGGVLPSRLAVIFGLFLAGVVGNILWRIICEMLIVQFRIYELLHNIDVKRSDIYLRDTTDE